MDISPELAAALKLPTGTFLTLKIARLNPSEATLINMDSMAVTNATSEVPIIGTKGLSTCTTVILYNKKTKTAAICHETGVFPDRFQELVRQVRDNSDEQLAVHVIGAPISVAQSGSGYDKHFNRDTINQSTRRQLQKLVGVINATPNAQLKTFDVYDKPKPNAVAIDARNGKLIRDSKLFTTQEQSHIDKQDSFKNLHFAEASVDFDGTQPHLQKQRRHE